MNPITFACRANLPQAPEEITAQILDLSKWPEFDGCWPIPGIKSARFVERKPEIVGTRIRVTSRDGSTHVEEIVEWNPGRRVRLRMQDFSRPLSRFATKFEETLELERSDDG